MAANPEYNPSGVGDCIDTNKLPWIPIPNAPGMSIKPARDSGCLLYTSPSPRDRG